MDLSKTKKLKEFLLFAYLALFPFGQLLSIRTNVFGFSVPFHPADIIAGLLGVGVLIYKGKLPTFFAPIKNFLWVLFFSLVFSLSIFKPVEVLPGALYALRLAAYSLFFAACFRIVQKSEKVKAFVFSSLAYIGFFIAVFGLFQYFFYPDVRPFTIWGWDDHLFRLVGTFLDPGFTSIFLVFGFLATIAKLFINRDKKLLVVLAVFILALALTYSRAGYVAFLGGILTFLLAKKSLKKVLVIMGLFAFIVLLIPSFGSEGVHLGRTKSIFTRLESYSEAIKLTAKSPVFGVGFNNLCMAKDKFLGQTANFQSHACSGIESSLLMLLATTGVTGLIVFVYLIYWIVRKVPKDIYGLTFISSLVALLLHSLFVNSLFYPWVMGWMGLLLGVSFKEKS